MYKVAFVTYRAHTRMTTDDSLTFKPLAQQGVRLMSAAWDDYSVRWADYDLIVIRSTWDYHLRLADYLLWLERMENEGHALWNPPGLVRWNADKVYLRDLADQGVPVIPSVWLAAGEAYDLSALMAEHGWADVVIKPRVSAGAHQTLRVPAAQAARQQRRLDALLRETGAVVQPFMPQVASEGEWSLIFFRDWEGTISYSHAAKKFPAPGDMRVQEEYGGQTQAAVASDDLIAQARAMVEAIPGEWLYARVDAILDDARLLLMELELIEPHLYMALESDAPQRFAHAIRSLLG